MEKIDGDCRYVKEIIDENCWCAMEKIDGDCQHSIIKPMLIGVRYLPLPYFRLARRCGVYRKGRTRVYPLVAKQTGCHPAVFIFVLINVRKRLSYGLTCTRSFSMNVHLRVLPKIKGGQRPA